MIKSIFKSSRLRPAVPKMDISADGPGTAATVSFKISCDASARVTQAVTAECG
jgi:hypothetical protein